MTFLTKIFSHRVTKSIVPVLLVVALFLVFAPVDPAVNSMAGDTNKKDTYQPATAEQRVKKNFIVAGGCFWCIESDFEMVPGVAEVTSGYINGKTENPTYRQVASKQTGHYEVVKIEYYPYRVSLETLVDYYWKTIDPTDDGGQFCDRGSPYKTGLFYQNDEQKKAFTNSLNKVKKTKPFIADIVTPILEAKTFYDAEDYHQDYYAKNSFRYSLYRKGCGRDKRIKELWGVQESKKYH